MEIKQGKGYGKNDKKEKGGEMQELKRVSEVLGIRKSANDTVPLTNYLDKFIIIKGYELIEGIYGQYAIIKAEYEGNEVKIRTGSSVVINKLHLLEDKNGFPVLALVVRKKRYYDII